MHTKKTSSLIKILTKIYSKMELNLGIKKQLNQVFAKINNQYSSQFSTNIKVLDKNHYTFRPRNETSSNPKNDFAQFAKLFNLEVRKIKKEIDLDKSKYLGVELPEGMKKFSSELSLYLNKKLNKKIIMNLEPCFGACDIKYQEFESIGVKTIVHIGNAKMPNVQLPNGIKIIYVPLYIKIPIKKTVAKSVKYFRKNKISKIGLISSISFIKNIKEIKKILESNSIQVLIGQGNKRLSFPGHVLGCNASSASIIKDKVDIFVMYEDGSFHAPAVSLTTKTDVVCFDPLTNDLVFYSYKELQQKAIEERTENFKLLSKAKKVGLLISTKIGQNRSQIIHKLEEMYSKKGYQTTILIANYIDPKSINTTDFDMCIASMCPRVGIDERKLFSKPLLTIPEAIEFIRKDKINENDFKFDQID